MTVVTGPLNSIDAHGQWQQTYIFQVINSTRYYKTYATPTNPNSNPQLGIRVAARWIMQNWQNLTAAEKASWQQIADRYQLPLYHAWLRHNTRAWIHDTPPVPQPTPSPTLATWLTGPTATPIGDNYNITGTINTTLGEPFALALAGTVYLLDPPSRQNTFDLVTPDYTTVGSTYSIDTDVPKPDYSPIDIAVALTTRSNKLFPFTLA